MFISLVMFVVSFSIILFILLGCFYVYMRLHEGKYCDHELYGEDGVTPSFILCKTCKQRYYEDYDYRRD